MDILEIEGQGRAGEILGRVITFGLFAVMAFSVLAFGTVDPWSIAVFNISIVGLFLCWAIRCVVQKKVKISLPTFSLPIGLLFAYGILQSVTILDETGKRWSISMDVEATRLVLEVLICLLISFLLAATFFKGYQRLHWLKNFLIFFGLALAVFALLQHFTWNGKFYWFITPTTQVISPFGPFVNHNHFAGYLGMIVPIPVALIWNRSVRGELAVLYGFAAAVMSIATIVSFSRGGIISLLSGVIFVVLFGLNSIVRRKDERKKIAILVTRAAVVVLLLATIAAGVVWIGADSVIKRAEKAEMSTQTRSNDPRKETISQSRGWIWRDTLVMIRDNWAMGVGLGAYQTAFPIYSERDGSLIVAQAHNDYLQILADCGIIGVILTLWFLVLVIEDFRHAIRHRNPVMSGMALGCGGGVFSIIVHSIFDFNLQLPSNALLFLVLAAVIFIVSSSSALNKISESKFKRAAPFRDSTERREVWS
ncbi:MAG: O-antigen ligase family protein [Acidobacteria bacterium]|nr:O-antigen ligase family protein [Acidobacteriota bacterium]